ncbi:AsnC family transcriptional regulator [Natronoarchaeum sp. GCM10025321]|uniref:AsnC family transcriptional regulator n=1 Tax=Natronoarchaeum sp. GCM10025321 TaxID=3252684 RepID=UPI00360F2C1A
MPLDDTDAEILRLLIEDASRSYREIGEEVDLTAPSVSDRVERLRELGVLERFTVAVDQSMFANSAARLVDVQVGPGEATGVAADLDAVDGVEHVIRTESGRVVAQTHLAEDELRPLLSDLLADREIIEYSVEGVVESAWNPELRGGEFAVDCVECGKTVEGEGVTIERDGHRYVLCCHSCESLFLERYDELNDGLGD